MGKAGRQLYDRTGLVFGPWMVISREPNDPNDPRKTRWLCRCICGIERVVYSTNLHAATSNKCNGHPVNMDLTGQRFGRLLVLGKSENAFALCRCDCGVTKHVRTQALRKSQRSCGCIKLEIEADALARRTVKRAAAEARLADRKLRAAILRSPTHRTWTEMSSRCRDPRRKDYEEYGARGITVCDRWADSFDVFLADMGERPPNKTIDRKDNDGNYEPGNCRWATPTEQNRNSRHTKLNVAAVRLIRIALTRGESLSSLGRRFGVTDGAIYAIKSGRAWADVAA